ncbi:hypothetical protein FPCIR_12930 [Fusarium pseudocircinatum]|uniref:Uncharacterized protein n=1 Tax=Fusarium pseudocircinatum TaxID=56676 RepID=A0A8H5KKD9_9HYPO|nr:hypothetical protein FPCIR_12930 [Fusarium pseudocircinatum]
MAPPHHQNNRNNRDYRNRSRSPSRTSRAQTGGSQNEDVTAAQQTVDQAMERQRQAQRGVAEAMKWQREVQREVDEALERQRQVRREAVEALERQREVQREVYRLEHRANGQNRSHRRPSVASNRNTSSSHRAERPTGITKPQQSSSAGQGVTMNLVHEAERRDFVTTRHGPGGVSVVNKSLSTGEQKRSYHFPPYLTGSMEGATHDMDELKAVGEHVQRVNGCDGVSFHVEPRIKDAKRFLDNADVVTRVTSSSGRTKGQVEALGEPSRVTEISRQPGSECAFCESKTHTLRHCLDASGHREISGCILCNKNNHFVDKCRQFRDMSLKQQVEPLVFERANMPRIKVSEDFPEWYELLEEGIASGDIDANAPMKGFPWSGSFCSDLGWEDHGDKVKALQQEFDESGFDMSILPVDPNAASLSAVRDYYSERPQAFIASVLR